MQAERGTADPETKAGTGFPDRPIWPPWPRRLAFAALGLAAAAVRAITAPRRSFGTNRNRVGALVLEPFGMGDALLLQPLVRALLAAGRKVAFAGNPAWAPLFPAAEGFVFVPAKPAWARPDPAGKYRHPLHDLLKAARKLRPFAKGADCIEPRGDPRAILALYLAGARTVRSLPRYWSATDCRLPPLAARFVPLDRRATRREVSRAFAPAGVPYGRPDVSHLLKDAPKPDPSTVGLVPLTPWEGKRWPPERWAALIEGLRARGFSPTLLCGPGEAAAARATSEILSGPVPVVMSRLLSCKTIAAGGANRPRKRPSCCAYCRGATKSFCARASSKARPARKMRFSSIAGAMSCTPTGSPVASSSAAGTLRPQSPERFNAVVNTSERYICSGSVFAPKWNAGAGVTGVRRKSQSL